MYALRFSSHATQKVLLSFRGKLTIEEEILHSDESRDRVADFVCDSRGEPSNARHPLASHELGLGLGQSRRRLG